MILELLSPGCFIFSSSVSQGVHRFSNLFTLGIGNKYYIRATSLASIIEVGHNKKGSLIVVLGLALDIMKGPLSEDVTVFLRIKSNMRKWQGL